MNLETKFRNFIRVFQDKSPLALASQEEMEEHAELVAEWLELTLHLKDSALEQEIEQVLSSAMRCAKLLYCLGDDISAWIGQKRIADAAEKHLSGSVAAYHLAIGANFSAQLHLADYTTDFLQRMRFHFRAKDSIVAAHYWALQGLIANLQQNWLVAIPFFQKSISNFERCSTKELKIWLQYNPIDLIGDRLQQIADCWINLAWASGPDERREFVVRAQDNLERAYNLTLAQDSHELLEVNRIELNLLQGNLEDARKAISSILGRSQKKIGWEVSFRPAVHFMNAKLASIEEDLPQMIQSISEALIESTHHPDAMQELMVVNKALDLIRDRKIDRKQFEPILSAMVSMLEAKDWYTGFDHSKSVAKYTIQLWDGWQSVPKQDNFRKDLFWAGYLHDIGKLKLPRSLLNKIAPLSPEEWQLLKLHPQKGQEILEIFGINTIAQWVSEHHQNARGSGYPGNEPASPMGLCISLADSIEAATTTSRKYKKPKSFPEVIREFRTTKPSPYPLELISTAETLIKLGS